MEIDCWLKSLELYERFERLWGPSPMAQDDTSKLTKPKGVRG